MVGISPAMVGRYCRLSVQCENALAAIIHLDRTACEGLENGSKKSLVKSLKFLALPSGANMSKP